MASLIHVDKSIARRILKGDERAFRELFDHFFPRLYRFALVRLNGDPDATREVVQQTFCKALESLDSYRGEAALYSWFCQICRNTVVDYCRVNQRQRDLHVPFEDEPGVRAVLDALSAPANDQPENETWRRDVSRLVQATLDALPPRYGDVLELKYVEGYSVKEIAARLGISAKATESTLTRARAAFREAIEQMTDGGQLLGNWASERFER